MAIFNTLHLINRPYLCIFIKRFQLLLNVPVDLTPDYMGQNQGHAEKTRSVLPDMPLLLIFTGAVGVLMAFWLIGLFVGRVVLAVAHK
jgi:hypothetical protein